MLNRCVVRSFDHRCVRAIKQLEPRLRTAILVAGTALVEPEKAARRAVAEIYCPQAAFLDERQVQQLHKAGIAVLPWTVNEPSDWQPLLLWGVDGITTDYPDRLAAFRGSHMATIGEAGVPAR
jgi:glycerophosphoryl diester phosphodiesterase